MPSNIKVMLPTERIEKSILQIRGLKVMLDADLAVLYRVDTKVLLQAVKRNPDRFPEDFMFQLTETEWGILRSQFVTSSSWGGRRYPPYVFTEHGVAMLSSVLNSPRAIQVNLQIMRTFTKLREIMSANSGLAKRLDDLERKYDRQFAVVFDAIRQLMEPPPEPPKPRIGFHVKEATGKYRYGRKK
jgi:hypothetical protein